MNLRRISAIARKEGIHIRRDPRSLILAIGIPMLMLLMFGYALTLDVDRVPYAVWDQSRTPESRDFLARFAATRYFTLQAQVQSYAEMESSIDRRDAIIAFVIPPDFAPQLAAGRVAKVQALLDGSDANTALLVLGYAQAMAATQNEQLVASQLRRLQGAPPPSPLELRTRVWFNPDLESRNFIVPGIMAVIMGLIAALLTSLTIAREWERGTMEQLLSTPVRPSELIMGKLIPYVLIGLGNLAVAVIMTVFLFHVPLRGSVPLLFLVGTLFIAATLAQGILISTLARRQLLASQLAMLSTFLPAFLLSGFAFAIANMPPVVRAITLIVPARYFVALVKGLFLRGTGLSVLWPDALFLLVFASVVITASIRLTRRRIA